MCGRGQRCLEHGTEGAFLEEHSVGLEGLWQPKSSHVGGGQPKGIQGRRLEGSTESWEPRGEGMLQKRVCSAGLQQLQSRWREDGWTRPHGVTGDQSP